MYLNFFKIIAIFFVLNSCTQKQGEDEVYLIPNNFIGHIVIVFEQPDGEDVRYENGKRVYVIPKNGFLKSKFKANYGSRQITYFYVDKLGKRELIPSYFNFQQMDSTQINHNQIVYFGMRMVGRTRPAQVKKTHFRKGSIGKISQIDSLMKTQEQFFREKTEMY